MRDLRSLPATLCLLTAVLLLVWAAGQGAASPPAPRLDPDLGVPIGEPLRSVAVTVPPSIDGRLEAAWEQAPALTAPLHYGLHGDEPAGTVELRSLYDEENVYFLAHWPSATR